MKLATQPVSVAQFKQLAQGQQPSSAQDEMTRMFARLQSVVAYLQEHGHGGKVCLPLPPNRSNPAGGQQHWAVVRAQQQTYFSHCNIFLAAKLIPAPPAEPPAFARVETTLYVARLHDTTNIVSRCKWPEDWLVSHGYISGDSPRHIESALPVQPVVSRRLVRIVFEITVAAPPIEP